MTYGHESSLWFKIDASIDAETGEIQEERWAELKSRLGVHQGRPLSCFLAALGLAKCLNAAQAAIDNFNDDNPYAHQNSYLSALLNPLQRRTMCLS